VRVGSIASMPLEPVSTRLGALEAYLVEARSVGGLSGSPVYVRTEAWREDENHQFHPRFGGNAWHLLGIMHGHWQAPMEDVAVDDGLSTEYVNMGIAVVTPIDKLLELVEQPPLSAVLAGMTRTTREGLQAASEHVERGADRLTTEA
jgi:hypothetical protein